MHYQASMNALIAIQGAGLVIVVGVGIAAFLAWRKAKREAEAAVAMVKTKAAQVLSETEIFMNRLRTIAES